MASSVGGAPVVPAWFVEPTLWQRFAGSFIDSLIVSPFLFGAFLVDASGPVRALVHLIGAVYVIGCTAVRGQTLGKMAMGTRVVEVVDGSSVTLPQSVLRWAVLTGVPLAVFYLTSSSVGSIYSLAIAVTVLSPPLHRGIHDRISGTIVTATRIPR